MMKQVQAVMFDWAGTVVDFGSFAPTSIFVEAFKREYDFDISLAEARVPMGLGKWDHIKCVGELPEVAQRWQAKFGKPMDTNDIDKIYQTFMPLQIAKVAQHADLIPGTKQVVAGLRDQGIKIGSCTGYPRVVLNELLPAAKANGFSPDCAVATDDLAAGGRPAPYMLLKNMIELAVDDVKTCVKVDDSVPGITEGLNAGMWTVALLLSGNEAGLTQQEFEAADDVKLMQARNKAKDTFAMSGAHYHIDTVAQLPEVITDINRRLTLGERP
ncbi:phosphonoacetaldehyde hydrolase [Photobacterium sanguinicancri]|uniref:phosphonoacetaldehyde hydrolase n=1 Tax=Photobacterium sanguinicancri TaxID=875932 RepID=UPI0026E15FA5|nr:phosphonoacetaldehyde hydrolase [Photobacterium sanguinicancri]MDO6499917.1 phosphonoacetaldehyde hydrolase [Photobacterium sanguinicancri]